MVLLYFEVHLQDPPAMWHQMPQLQTTQQHVLQDGEFSMSSTDFGSTYHLIVLLHFPRASSSSSNRRSDQMRNAETTFRATGKRHSIEETEQPSSNKRPRRK